MQPRSVRNERQRRSSATDEYGAWTSYRLRKQEVRLPAAAVQRHALRARMIEHQAIGRAYPCAPAC